MSTVTPSHRARIPSFSVDIDQLSETNTAFALNLEEAVFYKRSLKNITNTSTTCLPLC